MKPELKKILARAVVVLSEAVLLTETKDGQEMVVFANPAFERLTGYSLKELAGQDPAAIRTQEPENPYPMLSFAGSDEGRRETVLRRKDGTIFLDRISISKYRAGKKSYSLEVHADVTQQREIENRFVLAQKREASSYLVNGLAHDFNNLLTAILVYSGLIAPRLKEDALLDRYLGEIRGAAEQGAQLVAELMNLGRADSAEPELVDLGQLVSQTSDLLKRILGEDVRLNIRIEPDLHKVRVHAGRIQQVLLNLGINAKDAMPKGGDFFVRLSSQKALTGRHDPSALDSYVSMEIEDSGTGMDGDTCASLFQPFFSTKGKGKGTGLGLFTARTIIEHYRGHMIVESEIGKGTIFKILLPAVPADATAAAAKATLLLVENKEAVRRSLGDTLSQRGYKVLPAANSNQALAVAQCYSGEIALLLANSRSPGSGDPGLGKKILKVRPEIKLLFMGHQNNGSKRSAGNGRDFVKRPFSPSVLVHKIEEVLNRPSR